MFLTITAALSLAIWLYLLLARGGFWRMRVDSPAGNLRPPVPSVTAVVPARNEADVVGRSIASLAAQRYSGEFHMILVDDSSQDGTARLACEASSRLNVIPARPLPPGWTGKMWAVAEGVRSASGDYLLLTDADIVHPPDHLAELVARAEHGGYDVVSFMVRLHCRSFAEQALIPAFVFFFFLLYPPSWIPDPRHRTAGAAGGCILLRRTALERIGGIERIRGELIDDCALARAVKRSGGRVWLGLSDKAASIRPYHTFGEIGRMISRTAFTQLHHSFLLLIATIAGLALTYLAPPLLTLAAPAGPASGMAAMAWLLMTAAYLPAVRYTNCRWFWAPYSPPSPSSTSEQPSTPPSPTSEAKEANGKAAPNPQLDLPPPSLKRSSQRLSPRLRASAVNRPSRNSEPSDQRHEPPPRIVLTSPLEA